jgi:hypothetical protein
MLRRVALVRTNVSEELSASFSPIVATLMKEALSYSETSVLTRATWRNIPEDAILNFFSIFKVLKFKVLISSILGFVHGLFNFN